MAMVVYWILFPAILTSFFALSSPNQPDFDRLLGELEEAKLRNTCANSALKESIQKLQSKRSLYLKEREEWIQDMDDKIRHLQSALSNLKEGSPHADERLKTLEEEVQLLWAASRKNNFDLHALEAQARYAEDQLALVTSQAKKMVEVVTEQWFQIQHLEQALEIAKIKALQVQRQSSMRCTFLKFINDLSEVHLPVFTGAFGSVFNLATYISQTLEQFKSFFSSAKKCHHEFQAFIKTEMVKYEFTAALANDELVFYLVSYCVFITISQLFGWNRPHILLARIPGFHFTCLASIKCLDVTVIAAQLGGEDFSSGSLAAYSVEFSSHDSPCK